MLCTPGTNALGVSRFTSRHPRQGSQKPAPSSAEYTIGTNYTEYLASLRWNTATADKLDIIRAEATLEEDCYGVKEIKDRILEYLVVRILKASRKHRILVVDDEKTTCMNLERALTLFPEKGLATKKTEG